ncbi:LTA synthase family protein [Rhodanobacter sp. C05]|uniref:LTA synthase family protein n=1 Tax=Rhodanobacter sp. C05 TaxID=1945855 RepID=UPI0009D04C5B|nr:LTA synthase family protein [Rhodanobacter sp. C05]OOG37401.1 hypothetical protein B0E51_16220 [Rhodanobacter sp. C05]
MRAIFSGSSAWATCARLLIIALLSIVMVVRLDSSLTMALQPGLVWRNALPIALFILLIYGLCGRLLLSLGLGSGITWLVFNVNAVKELNMNAPLLPGDLVLVHQVLHNMGFFAHYTGYRLVLLSLAALLFAMLMGTIWWAEKRWQRPRATSRAVWILLSSAALFTMYQGDGFWPKVYGDEALAGFQQWDPILSVQQTGFMAGMVRTSQESRISIPQADKQLVAHFAQSHAGDLDMRRMRKLPLELPDIVVVQSEAFFDPGPLKNIDYGQYVPNFERLAATGISGSLTTPTYGGGTIRTEFETLTGYPMQAFPSIQYPYYGLASGWMPTVPRRLEAFGYSTTLFHPFRAGFWNRAEVMPELGFQRTYYEKNFSGAAHAGEFVSDHALFDFVLAHFDEGNSGAQYAMVITMENHGPWDYDAGSLTEVLNGHPLPSGLSAAGTKEMTYYLSHLVNGDAALGDFAQRLLARPRWTILLFYGDHLPALDAAFKDLGFDDGRSEGEEHTRYMLLSNRPLDPQNPRQLDLSSYQLPELLFDTVGLPEDGYLALASTIRQDWERDHFQHTEQYRQLQFNAALLEVSCGHKLSATGKCKRQVFSSVTAAGK